LVLGTILEEGVEVVKVAPSGAHDHDPARTTFHSRHPSCEGGSCRLSSSVRRELRAARREARGAGGNGDSESGTVLKCNSLAWTDDPVNSPKTSGPPAITGGPSSPWAARRLPRRRFRS